MTSKVIFDTKGLDNLLKITKGKAFAKVGILSGTTQRDEQSSSEDKSMTNVEIGVIHEFGSASQNTPPRSFLRMPLEEKSDIITEAGSDKGDLVTELAGGGGINAAVERMGLAAEAIIQDAFSSNGFGKWAANSQATIARKGSSAPLIDTGQLRRAVTSEVVSG